MGKLKEKYQFRLARYEDEKAIMDYIKEVWKPTHILGNNIGVFEYLHLVDGRLNFLLAIDKESGKIEGLEGFIQYSKALLDVGPVMWSVRKENQTPMLGLEIVKELKAQTHCRLYASPGSNPKTSGLLHEKYLGHPFGRLSHYYMVNNHKTVFRIGAFPQKKYSHYIEAQIHIEEIYDIERLESLFDFEEYRDRLPYKDAWYIKKRYFRHPTYKYRKWFLQKEDMACVVIGKEVQVDEAKIFRIIDILGDVSLIRYMGSYWEKLLVSEDYEYVDIYVKAFMGHFLEDSGFYERKIDDEVIVPNYFEPFLQKNIEIYYNNSHTNAYIFKGDSDQDRPS